MNRRRFIQSLAAVFSLPSMTTTLSMPSATAAIQTASAVPAKARFWGIYMSGLHGECPPHALQAMLNIPEVDAKRYVSQLIAEGIIKPNPLLHNSVSKVLNSKEDGVLDKVKKRFDKKSQAQKNNLKVSDKIEVAEDIDDEEVTQEDLSEVIEIDKPIEIENSETIEDSSPAYDR